MGAFFIVLVIDYRVFYISHTGNALSKIFLYINEQAFYTTNTGNALEKLVIINVAFANSRGERAKRF